LAGKIAKARRGAMGQMAKAVIVVFVDRSSEDQMIIDFHLLEGLSGG
jgi:hypothetical protein